MSPFQRVDRFYTSESDICRRSILTYKDGSRAERVDIFLMAVDPQDRYLKESKGPTKTFMMISN